MRQADMSLDTVPSAAQRGDAGTVRSDTARIQGKLKAALLTMAWEGLTFDQAARKANLSTYAMRLALDRPHVQSFLRKQRQVFRASLVDRATFRMVELSEQDDNRAAAVTATAKLMSEEDQSVNRGPQHSAPGFVILIQTAHGLPNAANGIAIEAQAIDNADQTGK